MEDRISKLAHLWLCMLWCLGYSLSVLVTDAVCILVQEGSNWLFVPTCMQELAVAVAVDE